MAKQKNEVTVIPKIKVHPNKIILYNEFHYSHHRPSRKNDNSQYYTTISVERNGKLELVKVSTAFLNSTRQSDGTLSKQAKKKLSNAINYFLLINKPNNGKTGYTGRHFENKIAFITLTLPSKQVHSDNEIKQKCLNQFMVELHKYHKITNYIWRAEYQKNGNIHFHILVNRFIPWNDVRNRWNRIVNKLGYVDRYREELQEYHKNGFQVRADLLEQWPLKKQYEAYKKGLKTDWHNPNSIDVHGIKNISNILNYLTKYLTKNEQANATPPGENLLTRKEIGRIWSSSTIFSQISGATTEVDSYIEENLKTIEEHFKDKFYSGDYFTIIDISINEIESLKCLELLNLFYSFMLEKFNYSYQYQF